jgi:hypothetical protein
MLDKEAKVQGVAVYAEFVRAGETTQMLITPDCYTNTGTLTPMAIHRRVVTPASLKKQWRSTPLRNEQVKEFVAVGVQLDDEKVSDFTDTRMRYAFSFFDEMVRHDWVIRQEPILVEVSKYDADDIAKNTTPSRVLYRVGISRKALGFPAELV